jgi:Transposase DDE domain
MVADGGRRGYRHLLEAFWADAKDQGVRLPREVPLSAAAFCTARRKLKAAAVRVLLQDAVETFDRQHGAQHRFRDRRVLAVDSSKIPVQRCGALWDEFGGPPHGYTPQVMVSTLFDVIAKLPVDATVAPFSSCEREQLGRFLDRLRPLDVLVLDQGFPSYEVIDMLLERQVDFVIRVPIRKGFAAVGEFERSGLNETDIVLAPAARNDDSAQRPRDLRLVRRDGPDGEAQVFLTSLRRSSFPRADILELYRRRWEVELFYRLEKGTYLGHDQFHARNADGVRQEVFALLLFIALSRTLMAATAQVHNVPYERISQKGALLAAANRFTVLLLHRHPERARELLRALLLRISRCLDEIPRERSFPRRSFKPRPQWAPNGHARDPNRRVQVS